MMGRWGGEEDQQWAEIRAFLVEGNDFLSLSFQRGRGREENNHMSVSSENTLKQHSSPFTISP
jgi:hypothetical protein